MSNAPRLMIADSGIGGLSVSRAINYLIPEANITYCADYAAFPYGDWQEDKLSIHIVKQYLSWAEEIKPDALIVACNTASTLVLPALRDRLSIPVVGTVPAVKPAALFSQSGMISLLATPSTIARNYTQKLREDFAMNLQVEMVASANLADLSERLLLEGSSPKLLAEIATEIAPCFVKNDDSQTDCIVLGCTHYPLIKMELMSLAPWSVQWIDPALAVARQTLMVLEYAFPKHITPGDFSFKSNIEGKIPDLEKVWQKIALYT